MKPVDFRNATYADLQDRLVGLRQAVLAAWQKHGPCTTEDLAKASNISVLTLRPRTTELAQLGFVRLADAQKGGGGVYRASTPEEVQAYLRAEKAKVLPPAPAMQPELELNDSRRRYY